MKQLRVCVWVGKSKNQLQSVAKPTQSNLEGLIQQGVRADFQVEDIGIWIFFTTIEDGIQFAQAVLEHNENVQHSVLITAGDIELVEGKWCGWALECTQSLVRFLEPRQIWFTETLFYLMDVDALSWENVGLVPTDFTSVRCFRMVIQGQSFVPTALKRAIREQKVIVCQRHQPMGPVEKGKHVVFVGYPYDRELRSQVARIGTVIPNDRMWLVLPRMEQKARKAWTELGRHLIISESDVFLKDIVRTDLTLMDMGSNGTLFLDPVKLSSGEVSVYGVALPQVPMARIIDGYTLDLFSNGEWGYGDDETVVARVAVNLDGKFITAFKPDCRLNSRDMEIGKSYPLGNGARLTIGRLTYRYIADVGKPYCGLFLGESTKRLALSVGSRIELGRQPVGNGFGLPDRGGAERIQWGQSVQAQTAKKNKLTLDRALTGRQHVSLTVQTVGRFVIAPMHDKLPTFILPVASQRLQRVANELLIKDEGLIIVGTNVIRVAKTQ